MMWSLFDVVRRRITRTTRTAKGKRKGPARHPQLAIEMLERRDVPSVSITQNFNSTAIAPNDTVWFSSVINGVNLGGNSAPVNINVTNQTITFSDTKNGVITVENLSVPDAVLTLTSAGTTASTTWDSTDSKWVDRDPSNLGGNLFLSGYALPVPNGLHSGDSVTWTATFNSDTSGVSFKWAWAAAAYTSFTTSYSSVGVKPCDDKNASSYTNNSDKAGTPENYKTHVIAGATGGGSPNYTGNFSSNTNVTPTYDPIYVSVAGTVYNDANNNGVYDPNSTSNPNEVGISGVTLTLTGQTSGGQTVASVTTTTASDGSYSFTVDGNGNKLVAGTYEITETQPVGYYQGSDNIGTVNGTADGTLLAPSSISNISLGVGQSGTGYDFGQVDPFTQVNPGYPTGTSGRAAVAFNESQTMAGASVNLATNTFDIFYQDEHALTLGVSSVTVQNANGTSTTTNYPIAALSSDPGGVVNPAVGDTNVTGTQAAVDPSGRPLFPSLYITDITNDPSSTSGDWQNYGTAVTPSAVYGAWKSYALTVSSTGTVTATGATDPASNGWNMGAGADPVPASISANSTTYGAEVQWSLNSLYNSGTILPGHNYRFYFIIHDGDQNQSGGDVGQAAFDFTYRGPVTVAGNVYKDVYGNGVDSAGDSGIGGVTLNLSGTNTQGQSITATTTTKSDGTYTFTTDSNGNLLTGGTYQVTETQPSAYLPGSNTVGMTDWSQGFQQALAGTNTTGNGNPGYTHEAGGSSSENVFSGTGSLDTNDVSQWGWTSGTVAATNDIVDAFGVNFNDSLTGHQFLLAGMDRYANTAATTVGFWAFQNAVSVNADGTFSGVHSNGDLLFVVNYSLYGATSVAVYEWNAGSLTPVTTAAGATYLSVNTGAASVPWSFTDSTGNTSPQAGEFMEFGVDLNAVYGLTVPKFVSFLTETRSSNTTGATLLDFAAASLNTVSGSFAADGTLVPPTSIGSIVIADGQNGINYNFGNVQPVTLAGTVYVDTNGNGVMDAGEPGIGGVALTLTGTSNLGQSVTATTTTAADGTYKFTVDNTGKLLPPGTYQVVETPPSGYLASGTNVGTDNGVSDGSVLSSSTIGSIVELTGDNAVNYNFGEVKPVTIAGTVFQDTNGNGVFDSGEPGMSGVTLTLSGTNGMGQPVTATATSAANGTYSFTTDSNGNQLLPGTYQIVETLPGGYIEDATIVGKVNSAADGTVVSAGTIGSIAMTSGQSGSNYNFGNVQPVSIGGLVYQDTNGNNVQDSGEPGLSGVTLTLSGSNGLGQSISATTTTAANGTYSFSTDSNGKAILPGTYQIVETQPSGYTMGAAAVGTVNGTADGTAASATKITSIGMTSGQAGINYNFGNTQPVTISGLVYEDINGTGIYNAGDSGVSGVTITLTGTNGLNQSITATATTAANGTFTFTTDSNGKALRPGTYTITETAPSGYLLGSAKVGTVNGTTDGTLSSATKISSIGLTSGQGGINYTFGDVKPVTISGTVYQDVNGTNSYSSSDPGIAGVTVTLTGTNNLNQSITATATTTSTGSFSFTTDSNGNSLRPGSYTITETQPSGYLLGAATPGTVNGTADGSAASATQISAIALTSGQSGINYLFGDVLPVSLSGIVYVDFNGTGSYSASDAGLAGVTLTLSGTNNLNQSITATTTTAADGTYSFTVDSNGLSLRPGTYQIVETQPNGYLAGATGVGTVNGTTDGSVVSTGEIGSIGLTSGQGGINYNFGAVQPVTISGMVYKDNNGNGVYDSGDTAFAGVTLTLSGTNGQGQSITATTITAADGTYSFTVDSNGNVLLPGTYQITETTPTGFIPVAANVGTVNRITDGTEASPSEISAIGMGSGQSAINYNFGLSVPAAISGYAYLDYDRAGYFDSNDVGFQGITVTITGTNTAGQSVNVSVTTDVNGYYVFAGLLAGTYSITITPPGGIYSPEAANVGTISGTSVGTANANLIEIDQVQVFLGQTGINYNFGITQPME